MKLSILLLLLTFVVASLYARHVHDTSINKNPNYKHQNLINGTTTINGTTKINGSTKIKGTTKINITTSNAAPVGRNAIRFPESTRTKMWGRSNSTTTNTNTNMFHTSNTTHQKYTKSNGTGTVTKKFVTMDIQTTTESNMLQLRFFINPPNKSACMDGLTRSVNGDCVFKFSDG